MLETLLLPELGENIEVADVSAVLVGVGDRIRRDQPVIEVETEKASLEVPAAHDGRVTELLVKAGDTIKVGQAILVVDSDGAADEEPATAAPQAKTPVATDRPASPLAGRPTEPPVFEPEPPAIAASATRPREPRLAELVPAAPSVRALARELGVDIREVPGRGRAGRISRDDVKAYAKSLILGARQPARPGPATPALPDFTKWGEVSREPMSRVRRATATNMANAWSTIPHVTQFDNADITELEAARRELNRRPEGARGKLTLTAIVIKRTAAALGEFPKFNASIDTDAEQVVYKKYVNIGVAVDTDRGLLVPVVRDADSKPLPTIAAELADLAARARDKKIRPEELSGSTFTVSNLGGLGTTHFSPIVNWPEVAILGVGRAEVRAEYVNEEFEPRRMLPLSLSYDHRLIDGADAARFLRRVAEALEQPLLQALEAGGGEEGDR